MLGKNKDCLYHCSRLHLFQQEVKIRDRHSYLSKREEPESAMIRLSNEKQQEGKAYDFFSCLDITQK